jgi:exodeoxyribonuclease-5
VASINARVRNWLYGEVDTPFVPGERALIRQPITRDDTMIFATNEEAVVEDIRPGEYRRTFKARYDLEEWGVKIPSWQVTLRKDETTSVVVHMPRDPTALSNANDRLMSEARIDPKRWQDFYAFKDAMVRLQAVYALTVHNLQGSTVTNLFLDVPDIRRREADNPREMLQLLYVGASRPTTGLFLVGV